MQREGQGMPGTSHEVVPATSSYFVPSDSDKKAGLLCMNARDLAGIFNCRLEEVIRYDNRQVEFLDQSNKTRWLRFSRDKDGKRWRLLNCRDFFRDSGVVNGDAVCVAIGTAPDGRLRIERLDATWLSQGVVRAPPPERVITSAKSHRASSTSSVVAEAQALIGAAAATALALTGGLHPAAPAAIEGSSTLAAAAAAPAAGSHMAQLSGVPGAPPSNIMEGVRALMQLRASPADLHHVDPTGLMTAAATGHDGTNMAPSNQHQQQYLHHHHHPVLSLDAAAAAAVAPAAAAAPMDPSTLLATAAAASIDHGGLMEPPPGEEPSTSGHQDAAAHTSTHRRGRSGRRAATSCDARSHYYYPDGNAKRRKGAPPTLHPQSVPSAPAHSTMQPLQPLAVAHASHQALTDAAAAAVAAATHQQHLHQHHHQATYMSEAHGLVGGGSSCLHGPDSFMPLDGPLPSGGQLSEPHDQQYAPAASAPASSQPPLQQLHHQHSGYVPGYASLHPHAAAAAASAAAAGPAGSEQNDDSGFQQLLQEALLAPQQPQPQQQQTPSLGPQ